MNQQTDGGKDELMTSEDEYAEVLGELRHAGELEAVPADTAAAAKACFVWRTMDAELAELTYDSSLDDRALAGVRSGDGGRFLTFESPALTVELEAVASGARRRIVGQLIPPQPGTVEVRHGGGTSTVSADAVGRFAAADLAPGPVSLRCQGSGEGAESVVTDWVLV